MKIHRLIAVALFLAVGGESVLAWALPQYALKEGKQCVYCHYDPRGGGPTNARGRYYAEHFTLDGYIEKANKKKKHRHRHLAHVPAKTSTE